MWKGKSCLNKNGGMISTFKVGYLPWHAINKLRFLFNTILRCNNEKVESIQIFLSIFVFILYFITISYSLTLSYLLFSLSCLQLYELSDDTKRKDFLDDLFAFMQKRGKNKYFLHYKHFWLLDMKFSYFTFLNSLLIQWIEIIANDTATRFK